MNKTVYSINDTRKGMSAFLALMIIGTLLVLATISLRVASDDVDISTHEAESFQAYYAAESGITHAVAYLRNDPGYSGSFSDKFDAMVDSDSSIDREQKFASYSVEVRLAPENLIISSGKYRGKIRTLRSRILSRKPLDVEKPREWGAR